MFKSILFWQPQQSLYVLLIKNPLGIKILLFLNYLIWPFLGMVSLILVKSDPNIFGQLFIATLFAEVIERFSKAFFFWSRPINKYKHSLPKGFVRSWYDTGSFPSGHTSKTFFFFLYICQYPVFSQRLYLFITVPLLTFRVLVGFHYPVDILGGMIVGLLAWLTSHQITTPDFLLQFIQNIFSNFFI